MQLFDDSGFKGNVLTQVPESDVDQDEGISQLFVLNFSGCIEGGFCPNKLQGGGQRGRQRTEEDIVSAIDLICFSGT